MKKTLFKAVMTRSRLRNKFIKNPNHNNSDNYKNNIIVLGYLEKKRDLTIATLISKI